MKNGDVPQRISPFSTFGAKIKDGEDVDNRAGRVM
jgi:hypothetical protein